ncbi:MAG TPA: ABC transporter substrate-binding protein [Caldimonas sp.]|nr:ABC transporter substrate-binding protein [Caldimonas sp.]
MGFLSLNRGADSSGRDGGFTLGLKELGYVEGRNIVVEHRDAAGRTDRLPALASELVALKVDVIVAPSTPAAQAAKRASETVPIVFAGAAEPISDGLVASLARPGGNLTGLSNASADLVGKRVELLKQVLPKLARVAVLWHAMPGQTDEDMLKATDVAARALGMQMQPVEARTGADLDRAFAEMKRAGADSLTVLPIATFFSERKRIIEMAAAHRLPAVYTSRLFVEDGGFMAYGANLGDLLRRAAGYVDRILKGARPSELPVEQATKFELVIHRGTARALGVTIPRPVLLTADDVIG